MNLIEYKGVLIRPNSGVDREMVNDCLKNYSLFQFTPGSVVMDLGVFVGGFAIQALKAGVKSYVGVEADEDNFVVAEANLKAFDSDRTKLLLGAASTSTESTLTFYQTGSGRSKCGGTVSPTPVGKGHRRVQKVVKNWNLKELLDTYKPTHLKMDIEGVEHDWFDSIDGEIPDHVQEFAVEIHRGGAVSEFSVKHLPKILKKFDLLRAEPAIGFAKVSESIIDIPALNIKSPGVLYGVDCFFRRKSK